MSFLYYHKYCDNNVLAIITYNQDYGPVSAWKQETEEMWVQSLGKEDPLEKSMATHSSVLAWRIPQTEELGGL